MFRGSTYGAGTLAHKFHLCTSIFSIFFYLFLLLALVLLPYVVFTLYPQHAQYPKHIHSSYIYERLYRSRGSLAIVHFLLALLAAPPAVRCFVWKKEQACMLLLPIYGLI